VVENFACMVVKEVLVDGFFHADPHAGNFLVMPGEVIGAIDFGVVGCLRDNDRLEIIKLYAVAIDLDADAIVDQLIHIGAANAEVDRMALSRDIDRLLNRYYGLALTDYRGSARPAYL
jgi:ubiquinone biosynthesis protein